MAEGERWLDASRLEEPIAQRFEGARPFGHAVIDELIVPSARASLLEALDDEPSDRIVDDIYEVNATGEPLTHPILIRFRDRFASLLRPLAEELVGSELPRLTMRGFAFGRAHYLLPHADRDRDGHRRLAFSLYLACEDLEGGELELFEVQQREGALTATTPALRIAPAPGRLVLMDVSDRSLHQVREVTAGLRVSLSGWFCT